MLQLDRSENHPRLLVSVRDATEALAALTGGADVIDVKEPDRGSLGAADATTIAAVVRTVNGRAPVTAAAGELVDLMRSPQPPISAGVSLFKIGLAGCSSVPNWPSRWKEMIAMMWPHADAPRHAVAVAYADWRIADSPRPDEVLRAAVELGSPALLIDTWNKSAGSLFDHWSAQQLRTFVQSVRSHKLLVVLAGSLHGESLTAAAQLRPDLLAVRTAACDAGRSGPVSRDRVASLHRAIAVATERDQLPGRTFATEEFS
ncbi:MAG: (5-formylfuran-3-yl)methyl phosphate synthase [Planctomycetes bacterium]|nr:(5-formylfuran-3-yl)methyl phosphate synthase [Planctomycetota bacterium]